MLVPATEISQLVNLTITNEEPLNTSDHLLVKTECRMQQFSTVVEGSGTTAPRPKTATRVKIKWELVSPDEMRELYTYPLEVTALELFTQIVDADIDEHDTEKLLQDFTAAMLEQSTELPRSTTSRKKRGKHKYRYS